MAITVEQFRNRFPEFADTDEFTDARISIMLSDAVAIYLGSDEQRWNGCYDIAQAYLSAHLLTLASQTEAGDTGAKMGAITAKTAGGVSVTRSPAPKEMSQTELFFSSTSYGQRYLVLRDTNFSAVLTVCYNG